MGDRVEAARHGFTCLGKDNRDYLIFSWPGDFIYIDPNAPGHTAMAEMFTDIIVE